MEQEPAIERKNFCRRHQSLAGQTPAMAAGLTDHVWTLRELIALFGGSGEHADEAWPVRQDAQAAGT
jgi:hypothetical protein